MPNCEIKDALKKFDDECILINESIVKDLISDKASRINNSLVNNLISNVEPSVIYHYTNDIGLKGILGTGKLWLTDIFDLNDPSELKLGLDFFLKSLKNKINGGYPEGKRIFERFEKLNKIEITERTAYYFVLSFSRCNDDIGQWRAYADNGRGFAIGFNTKIIENAFNLKDDSCNYENSTFPITYNNSRFAEIQNDLVEKLYQDILLRYRGNMDNDKLVDEICRILFFSIIYLNLLFKHQAYYSEQEYRFLQMHSADPRPIYEKRYHSYSLIKYREFDWRNLAPNAIKEIIIGPSENNKQKAYQFAKDRLQAAGINSVELTFSDIPYRAL